MRALAFLFAVAMLFVTTVASAKLRWGADAEGGAPYVFRDPKAPDKVIGFEVDLVTHDARKFFGLLLKKNGYVLEQLHSPLVVRSSPEHEELKGIARGCVTRSSRCWW